MVHDAADDSLAVDHSRAQAVLTKLEAECEEANRLSRRARAARDQARRILAAIEIQRIRRIVGPALIIIGFVAVASYGAGVVLAPPRRRAAAPIHRLRREPPLVSPPPHMSPYRRCRNYMSDAGYQHWLAGGGKAPCL